MLLDSKFFLMFLDQNNTIMAFNTHIFIMKYPKKYSCNIQKYIGESGGDRNYSLRRLGLEVSTGSSGENARQ